MERGEHLVKYGAKPGEVRNPEGKNGTPSKRMRNFHIKAALQAELTEPCDVPGFEHLTKYEYGIRNVVTRFMEGDRWAVEFVTKRLFGRVPLNVNATVRTSDVDYESMTPAELAERLRLLAALADAEARGAEYVDLDYQLPEVRDGVLVEPDPQGSNPRGNEPNGR